MAHATTPAMLDVSAGVLIGFGLSGCSFTIVIGAFGKLVPAEWRSIAFGAGTAAGSFGQFLYSPIGVALMDEFGWQMALTIFAGADHADPAAGDRAGDAAHRAAAPTIALAPQSFRHALAEAFGHRSYVLLGARLLHLRLPARLRHRPSAVLSDRPRPLGRGRRLDAGHHRPVQHHRLVDVGLARQPHAQALHPVDHLFPRARCRSPCSFRCRRARSRR